MTVVAVASSAAVTVSAANSKLYCTRLANEYCVWESGQSSLIGQLVKNKSTSK